MGINERRERWLINKLVFTSWCNSWFWRWRNTERWWELYIFAVWFQVQRGGGDIKHVCLEISTAREGVEADSWIIHNPAHSDPQMRSLGKHEYVGNTNAHGHSKGLNGWGHHKVCHQLLADESFSGTKFFQLSLPTPWGLRWSNNWEAVNMETGLRKKKKKRGHENDKHFHRVQSHFH